MSFSSNHSYVQKICRAYRSPG